VAAGELAHELSMNYIIVDATELVDPAEPILRNRRTRGGIPLWSNWDPVHLAPEAYQELADAVVTAGGADETDSASETAITASTVSQNRKRPESVVMVPRPPAGKRGRQTPEVKPAGWLHGHAEEPMRHLRGGHHRPWYDASYGRGMRRRYGYGRRPWTRHLGNLGRGGRFW
jgi:hypothetical protein